MRRVGVARSATSTAMRYTVPVLLMLTILRAGHARAAYLDVPDAERVLEIVDALLPTFLVDRLESVVRIAAEVCTFRLSRYLRRRLGSPERISHHKQTCADRGAHLEIASARNEVSAVGTKQSQKASRKS